MSAASEPTRRIDEVLQLVEVMHVLLIELDDDGGDATFFLRSRFYFGLSANRIKDCLAFA
jgi:hypothetical protein